MANSNSSLRFDHREIAVIFSLFVFVSLLMFTVGIIVGKGLAQAKYEAAILGAPDGAKAALKAPTPSAAGTQASSISAMRPDMRALISGNEKKPTEASSPGTAGEDDEGDSPPPRKTASKLLVPPPSLGEGPYTVQVGSYPTEKDAAERVEQLRKLGFPHAYFSAKELGDQKETWFRVWLGYYPDYDAAKKSGELLQQRGEVRNYLVRKSDSSG